MAGVFLGEELAGSSALGGALGEGGAFGGLAEGEGGFAGGGGGYYAGDYYGGEAVDGMGEEEGIGNPNGDPLTEGNNGLIGFEQFGQPEGYLSSFRGNSGLPPLPSAEETSSSAFKMDQAPQGFFERTLGRKPRTSDIFYADYGAQKVGQGIGAIFSTINNVYDIYRSNKKLHKQGVENTVDRHRVGIVFQGQESRDQLVRSNKMPAYYTSNIRKLLRKGIMPFGWNSEMAVEQGFEQEVYMQEMKNLTAKRSKDFLRRETEKTKLRNSLGDLKNLRDKFKMRKLLDYYNQN